MIISKTNMATNYSLMHEIETKNVNDDFSKNKEMPDFSSYSSSSKYYDNSNTLDVGKMKDELGGLAPEKYAREKPKIRVILVSDIRKYKKGKGVTENGVTKISHNIYRDVF